MEGRVDGGGGEEVEEVEEEEGQKRDTRTIRNTI